MAAPADAGVAAASWLAAGLLAAAFVGSSAPLGGGAGSAGCPAPRETAAARGHTQGVRCDGASDMRVRGPALLLFGLPIDINRADAETLAALPGIGVGRAAAIVRVRAEAPFQSVSDLARVPGIGVGTITRVARRVVILPADAEPFFSNPEIPHGLSPDDR